MTRDELIEMMAEAVHNNIGDEYADVPWREVMSRPRHLGVKYWRFKTATAALTAIESVIPVGKILSGECVVVPAGDYRDPDDEGARV